MRRRLGAAGSGLLLTGMLLLFFWPQGEHVRLVMLHLWSVARSWGLPEDVSPEAFSAVANWLVFVPLTFLLTVVFRGVPPRVWAISGFVMGFGIELVQMLLLDARVPETADALANGLGGVVGAGLGALAVRKSRLNGAVRGQADSPGHR